MDPIPYFRLMARNNAWSNYRLHQAMAVLGHDEYMAKRTSFFPSLHLTLNHILIADWLYLDALYQEGRGRATVADLEPCKTLQDLTAAQAAADRRLVAFCDRMTADDAARMIAIARPHGIIHDRIDLTLSHLFVHQIHHRGQVHAMLSGTSVPPPQLDEFFMTADASVRAADLAALGITEHTTA